MSNINIEVVDVEVVKVPRPSGKGEYEKATVAFKNEEGKLESKALMDWACPKPVWTVLIGAKKGDTFNIEREKNQKGYWDWKDVHRQEGMVVKSNPTPTKPTYETPDERAQRQVYIIRQSSIASAVALHGPEADVNDVLKTASIFVDFVMQQSMETLADDPV